MSPRRHSWPRLLLHAAMFVVFLPAVFARTGYVEFGPMGALFGGIGAAVLGGYVWYALDGPQQ